MVPALLRDELPAIGARRNVTEATLDLCTHRPLQLVPGLQDTALASITEQLAQGSAWDRTTPREREEIALRLQIERARAAGVDVETIMEEGK